MTGTNRKSLLFVGVLLLVVVIFGVEATLHPRVVVRVERTLVRPDEKAIQMLSEERPLDEIKKAMKESGKGVDDISWWGGSLLYWAVDKERLDVAEWLLGDGANPNGIDASMPPLGAAITRRNPTAVKLLVKWNADPDLAPASGVTPRGIAECNGDPEVLAALPSAKGSKAGHAKTPGPEKGTQKATGTRVGDDR
jgi:hypothetical protein